MADEEPTREEPVAESTVEEPVAKPAAEEPVVESAAAEGAAEEPVVESAAAEGAAEEPVVESAAAEGAAEEQAPAGEPVAAEAGAAVQVPAQEPSATGPAAEESDGKAQVPAEESPAEPVAAEEEEEEEEEPVPRVKPAVPGAHLEVDIVPEGADPLAREEPADPYAIDEYLQDVAEGVEEAEEEPQLPQPISTAAIDLAAGARYRATGKRKTATARVILRPGGGAYLINGRTLEEHFPRITLQRNIRQPLEAVGYEARMDVVARLHGGGVSAQAGALRHGVSRALLEADPNLRGELKRRGLLTRDSRAKERKKAGLKKARKRPQFSKR
jgi:small subunit ribosomal protein S9